MRNLMLTVALPVCVAVPLSASAQGLTPLQSSTNTSSASLRNQLPQLLQEFGINLISKAQAAECTEEGASCTSDENAALTLSALAVLQVRADRRTERVKDARQVPRVRSEGASGRFRSSSGAGAVEPVPPPPRSAGVATAAVTRWCLRAAFRPARSQPTTPARARISSALGTATPPQHCQIAWPQHDPPGQPQRAG